MSKGALTQTLPSLVRKGSKAPLTPFIDLYTIDGYYAFLVCFVFRLMCISRGDLPMAIYHLSAKILGRSGGKSAVASCAYQFRMNAKSELTGERFAYKRKNKESEVLSSGLIFSEEMRKNDFARNPIKFWNEVEKKEDRKNSRFARDFIIALPSEFTLEQNKDVLTKWFYNNFASRGIAGTLAIHAPSKEGDERNLHAHIMTATRFLDKNGWGKKDREANDKEFLLKIREDWANIVNDKFKEIGLDEKIDHRTLEAQGIDREPQKHLGVVKTAMIRKGKKLERVEVFKDKKTELEIIVTNEELAKELNKNSFFLELLESSKIVKEILEQREKETKEEKVSSENLVSKRTQELMQMSSSNWQEFVRNIAQEQKALETKEGLNYMQLNIKKIESVFEERYRKEKNKLNEFERQKPKNQEERATGIFAVGKVYKADYGERFKDYDKYFAHQGHIKYKYSEEWTKQNEMTLKEKGRLEDVQNKAYYKIKDHILNVPELRDEMKEYIKNKFVNSSEYENLRINTVAYNQIKDEKNREIQNQKRDKDRGYNGYER